MIRIARADAFAVSVPLSAPVRMAGITVASADNLIVRIEDSDGRLGWGEAASAPTMTGEFPQGMAAAGRFLAERAAGWEFDGPASVPAALDATLHGNRGVKAAFEIAILDLLGQAEKTPLCDLLGSRRRQCAPVLTMVAGADPDAEVAHAEKAAERGFTAFKVKVGVGTPQDDLHRCRRVRDALGAKAQISADANQGYGREAALKFARDAADAGLDYMEQLVAGRDLEGMAACAAASPVPLGADEGIHGVSDIQAHHDAGAASGGSLKTIKLGGLLPLMEAGRLMERLGMRVNLAGKVAETSIASAAVAHLAVALPALEWGVSVTQQYLADDVTADALPIVDGYVAPPDGAGLGVRPDESRLEAYRVRNDG